MKLKYDGGLSKYAFNFKLRRYSKGVDNFSVSAYFLIGKAVQVDPIKPASKAPGSERLKLKCGDLLSNVAFKLNLRRYT